MDKNTVAITMSFARIKGTCESIMGMPESVCEPGEKLLAEHILNIIKEEFEDPFVK